jgi:ferredoxin-NADP reductase
MNNKLILLEKINIIDNVWTFKFQPNKPIIWVAGQYIKVELIHDNTDTEGDKRYFTVSSAPFENNIQITTRITESSFKKAMSKLDIGDEITIIHGPKGDFIWQESELPNVFIIGGIGITPFISIIRQQVHDNQKINANLVYSNRTKDIPYMEEIDNWTHNDQSLIVDYEIGTPITVKRLEQLIPKLGKSIIYISGPELMVETIADQLKNHGLSDQQIKKDHFINYTENNY